MNTVKLPQSLESNRFSLSELIRTSRCTDTELDDDVDDEYDGDGDEYYEEEEEEAGVPYVNFC